MRRREVIAGLGSAAIAWPLAAAHAQQPTMPVIGFLGSTSPDQYAIRLEAFRQGLKEAGYVDGRNVVIEYRWAEGQYERLPGLAAALVQRRVAVIAAGGGTPSTLAAKAATSTIPIVFATSIDPVQAGLVASLNQPGGNLTGVANLGTEVGPKRLEVLRELLPMATTIAVLVNPASPTLAEQFMKDLQPTASTLGMHLHVVEASADRDFDTVFATLVQLRADALVIAPDNFFNSQGEQLAARALHHALPALQAARPFVAAGGLLSYGTNETEYYRLFGIQVGKILNGEKPADLPVQQSTKVELIINLKTAKALGISVPLALSVRADEVIE
ncbi:MAG TPA: ABC transporter substrate-binding protein [Stellaceae bacterium]|nr:ABC transporter substrate-binding protein [Stellaceae bacterium]